MLTKKTQKLAMHAGGGTNDRGEKRNVLIVSVLLPIGSDAAQQYAEARLCAEGATVRHFAVRGCLTQICRGQCCL